MNASAEAQNLAGTNGDGGFGVPVCRAQTSLRLLGCLVEQVDNVYWINEALRPA